MTDFVPRAHVRVSADHAGFQRPLLLKTAHTENYYPVRALLEAGMHEIHNSNVTNAVLIFGSLLRAGFAKQAFALLFKAAITEIGPAELCAFVYVCEQYTEFRSELPGPYSKKVFAHAIRHAKATQILMETVLVLTHAQKSRLVPHCMALSQGAPAETHVKPVLTEFKKPWSVAQLLQRWRLCLTEAGKGDKSKPPEHFIRALAWTHAVMNVHTRDSSWLTLDQITKSLVDASQLPVMRCTQQQQETIAYLLQRHADMGYAKERIFAAVIVLVWPQIWQATQMPRTWFAPSKLLEEVVEKCAQPLGRDYTLDAFFRFVDVKELMAEAAARGDQKEIAGWPLHEVRKSHSSDLKCVKPSSFEQWFAHTEESKSPISQAHQQKHPLWTEYRSLCSNFYDANRDSIKSLDALVVSLQQKDKEQWESWLRASLKKKPVASAKKRKTKPLSAHKKKLETMATHDWSARTKQQPPKKKRKMSEKKHNERKEEAKDRAVKAKHKERDKQLASVPVNTAVTNSFPSMIVRTKPCLEAKFVAMLTSRPFTVMNAARPVKSYMHPSFAWTGPFDVSDDSTHLRVRLIQHRVQFAQQMGLFAQKLFVYSEETAQHKVWLCSKHLAKQPSDNWAVNAQTNSLELATLGCLPRFSVDPANWQKHPQLIIELMLMWLFKLTCQPMASDANAGTCVWILPQPSTANSWSKAQLYEHDLSGVRSHFPVVKTLQPWHTYATTRKLEPSLLARLEQAFKTHRITVMLTLRQAITRVYSELSVVQRMRAIVFIKSLECIK